MLMLQFLFWPAVLAYMAGIWWISSKGADITGKVDAIGIPDFYWHLVLYGGLSLLLRFALWSSWPGNSLLWLALIAAAGAFAYGLIDEFHQSFIPGRGADAEDILGNFAGAVGMQILAAAAIWIS
jgi:VanZ family protein